jgi:hypothetical protein
VNCSFCGAGLVNGVCPVLDSAEKRYNLAVATLNGFEGSLTSKTGAKLRQYIIENEEIMEDHDG